MATRGDHNDGGTMPRRRTGKQTLNDAFRRFSSRCAYVLGSPWAFATAVAALVVWLVVGPIYHFSNTWQLVMNTATSVMAFLMVFLIQNTQNRDAAALHLKLDELIRATRAARTGMVDIEEHPDEVLEDLQAEFRDLARRDREQRADGGGKGL